MSLIANGAGEQPTGFYKGVATQSLRFDDGSSPYLNRTFSSSNRKTWTWSGWVKRSSLSSATLVLMYTGSGGGVARGGIVFNSSEQLEMQMNPTGNAWKYIKTNALHRDTSAWYHIVAVLDTTQATESNRQKFYVNGTEQTLSSASYPTLNQDYPFNLGTPHHIGSDVGGGSNFDGYLAEANFVDGTALDPTYFGETKNGVWIAKAPNVSEYGTNGFRLKFDQVGVGTASTSTIGADTSGKTNHFTSSGIVASDCAMPDSPENNFATLNPLYFLTASTHLSEGNLQLTHEATAHRANAGTMFSETGKWYFEVRNKTSAAGSTIAIGVGLQDISKNLVYASGADNYVFYSNNNNARFQANTSATTLSTDGTYTPGAGDIIQVAYDVDSGKIFIGLNNTYIAADAGADGNPATGANPTATLSTSIDYIPFVGTYNNEATANFGQDDTFAGAISSAGNTDGNGIGVFKYAPPSGFLALSTANLPEPTIGSNSTTQSDDHFNTVLYTGDGATRSITGVGFQPDWLWIKGRDYTFSHLLFDSNRGSGKYVRSDSNGAEADYGQTSFDTDGYSMAGTMNAINENNRPYVAWNWKANGGTTTTNDASSSGIGTVDSTFQSNQASGFSIVSYTGTGEALTVKHGLNVAPDLVIVKNRDITQNWIFGHSALWDLNVNNLLLLNGTNTTITNSAIWNNARPTSSVFSVGADTATSGNGNSIIAYCFAEVESYSKFGSYTGNGNANGPFVHLGFRPAWVMVKNTARGADWRINDATRQSANGGSGNLLLANSTSAEITNEYDMDFLSNGFKLRSSDVYENGSGEVLIYMAFAEAPFKYANAR